MIGIPALELSVREIRSLASKAFNEELRRAIKNPTKEAWEILKSINDDERKRFRCRDRAQTAYDAIKMFANQRQHQLEDQVLGAAFERFTFDSLKKRCPGANILFCDKNGKGIDIKVSFESLIISIQIKASFNTQNNDARSATMRNLQNEADETGGIGLLLVSNGKSPKNPRRGNVIELRGIDAMYCITGNKSKTFLGTLQKTRASFGRVSDDFYRRVEERAMTYAHGFEAFDGSGRLKNV